MADVLTHRSTVHSTYQVEHTTVTIETFSSPVSPLLLLQTAEGETDRQNETLGTGRSEFTPSGQTNLTRSREKKCHSGRSSMLVSIKMTC